MEKFETNGDRAAGVATCEPANICLSMCKLLDGSESMQRGLTSFEYTSCVLHIWNAILTDMH